jgi:hypothetical protein
VVRSPEDEDGVVKVLAGQEFDRKAYDAMPKEDKLRVLRAGFKDMAGIQLDRNCDTVKEWYMTRLLLKRECAQVIGTPALENVVLLAALAIISQMSNIYVYLKWLEQEDEDSGGSWATDVHADTYCATVLALFMLWVLFRCAMTSGKFESQLEQVWVSCHTAFHCMVVLRIACTYALVCRRGKCAFRTLFPHHVPHSPLTVPAAGT